MDELQADWSLSDWLIFEWLTGLSCFAIHLAVHSTFACVCVCDPDLCKAHLNTFKYIIQYPSKKRARPWRRQLSNYCMIFVCHFCGRMFSCTFCFGGSFTAFGQMNLWKITRLHQSKQQRWERAQWTRWKSPVKMRRRVKETRLNPYVFR